MDMHRHLSRRFSKHNLLSSCLKEVSHARLPAARFFLLLLSSCPNWSILIVSTCRCLYVCGPEMYITEGEMMKQQIPLNARDYCAHWLVSLNRCRWENYFKPWACHN